MTRTQSILPGRLSSLLGSGLHPMDDRSLPISSSTSEGQSPLPVVITLDPGVASASASLLSFTIPLHSPQTSPSWQELLGQR
ncbi:MAG: hypothetical protein ACKO8I_09880 [Cyanobacteriota bacterium]